MNEKEYGDGASKASKTPFARSWAPTPPSAKWVAERLHALGRHHLHHLRDLGIGVAREAVHRDDDGNAEAAHVVEVRVAGWTIPGSPSAADPRRETPAVSGDAPVE